GGGVDDGPAAGAQHLGDAVLHDVEDAVAVDAADLLVVVDGQLVQRQLDAGDARVVEHDVDPAVVIYRLADRVADRRGVRRVDSDGQGIGQRVRHPPGALLVDVGQHHFGAFAGEAVSRSCAQARSAAGHEGDLAVEPH